MDVESLYTNTDTSKGLEAIRECLQENPDPTRPDEIIFELLKINLERNDFLFDDKWFLQIKGTAMGERFSPAYANIHMAKWEKEAFQKCTKLPEAYYRYLGIWGVWNHDQEDLDHFIHTLNNHHPSIKIKPTIDLKQVVFLATVTYKGDEFPKTEKLDTKIHFESTDSHQLLHKENFHPKHTFKGILRSQLIRYKRICSNVADREEATCILFQALRKRKYPRSLLYKVKKEIFLENNTNKNIDTSIHIIPFTGPYSHFTIKNHKGIRDNFKQLQNSAEIINLPKYTTNHISEAQLTANAGPSPQGLPKNTKTWFT